MLFFTLQWLKNNPGNATIECIMIVLGAMFIGRHIFQNQPFQYSYSAFFGGMMVFWTYKLAGEVLQQKDLVVWWPFQAVWVHCLCLMVGIGAGLFFQNVVSGRGWDWSKTEYMDLFYALVFLPAIVYMGLVTIPLILMYGTTSQKVWLMVLYGGYGALFVIDLIIGHLDQVPYGRTHPIRSRNDLR